MDNIVNDVKTKMAIAKRVLQNCEKNNANDDTSRNIDASFKRYTYLDKVVKKDQSRREPIMFEELLHFRDTHPTITTNVSPSKIRHTLNNFYLNERKIPTLENLKTYIYYKNRCSILNSRNRENIILKSLPGTSRGIFVENPERFHRRMLYLKKMEQIRKDERHIVYVKSMNFEGKSGKNLKSYLLFIAVSNQLGLLNAFFYEPKTNYWNEWILKSISGIRDPCVVVLDEDEELDTPNLSSPKAEMSEWLAANGIQVASNAHRGEMYDLIKKAKSFGDLEVSDIDKVIEILGHQVVKCPKEMEELQYFHNLYKHFADVERHGGGETSQGNNKRRDISKKAIALKFVKDFEFKVWQDYEQQLIDNEWLMLEKDLIMEKFVDNLSMMYIDGVPLEQSLVDVPNWNKLVSKIILE